MKGFTLFELIISLLITSILVSIATPSMNAIFTAQKQRVLVNKLIRGTQLARQHAINSGQAVTLCGSVNESQCSPLYLKNLLVFFDTNNNFSRDDDEDLLLQVDIQLTSGRLDWNNHLGTRLQSDGSATLAGSFIFCPNDPSKLKQIKRVTINKAGRIYNARAKSDGVVRSASNRQINC